MKLKMPGDLTETHRFGRIVPLIDRLKAGLYLVVFNGRNLVTLGLVKYSHICSVFKELQKVCLYPVVFTGRSLVD